MGKMEEKMTEYKVGDKVMVDGIVAETSAIDVYVDFSNSLRGWVRQENIHPSATLDVSKTKFSVGDKVILVTALDLGVGKVIETDPDEIDGYAYRVKFSDGSKSWFMEELLVFAYPNKANK